eukprot:GHVU01038417.1.p1 GENE.GHVU01038417.1~~GHVU01038417.1.p1  ORF type:complete len:337 (+),score=72.11 GHVU01038417.1:1244-2254(+)
MENQSDETQESSFSPMSPADRTWLEAAIKDSLGNTADPMKTTEEAIAQLQQLDDVPVLLTALAVLDRCLDFPDVPRNLHKLGAQERLLAVAQHDNADVANQALALLALSLSNNPVWQQALHQAQGLQVLRGLVERLALGDEASGEEGDNDSSDQRHSAARAVSALSALVRNVTEIEREFVEDQEGVALLGRILANPHTHIKAKEKAASLLRHIVDEEGILEPQHVSPHVDVLVDGFDAMLSVPHYDIQFGEIGAQVLVAFVQKFPEDLPTLRPPTAHTQRLCEAIERREETIRGAALGCPSSSGQLRADDFETERGVLRMAAAALSSHAATGRRRK